MNRKTLWVLSSLLAIILLLAACASGGTPTPTPTAKPTTTTSASPKATATPKPTTTPSASPKPAPTTTATGVSFAGKTITLVVPNSPGGGTDIFARLVAQYLGRFLPGSPAIVVRNMPGGGETIGANYVYGAKPDGITTLMTSGAGIAGFLLDLPGVKYDLLKMPTIMGTSSASVVYANSKALAKPEDILNAKGLVVGFSSGSSQGIIFITLKELANFPIDKIVAAYGGAGDTRRAFLAGEINMGFDSAAAYVQNVDPLAKKGEVTPLYQSGIVNEKGQVVKDAGLPTTILTGEELYVKLYNKPPSGMAWDAYKAITAASRSYSKCLFLPPGTPDNIVNAYFTAAENMLKDAEFSKRLTALGDSGAAGGKTFQDGFRTNMKIDPKVRDWIKDILNKYQYAASE